MDIFQPCERKIVAGHLKISVREQQMLLAFIRNAMAELKN